MMFTLFLDFIYLSIYFYREEKGRRKIGKHQCVVASHVPPTGDLARNPGICPRLGIELATFWFTGGRLIH